MNKSAALGILCKDGARNPHLINCDIKCRMDLSAEQTGRDADRTVRGRRVDVQRIGARTRRSRRHRRC
ncbi:MAG: hypothetical protein ACREX9_17590 [Gammaproteobacteria bacterium]